MQHFCGNNLVLYKPLAATLYKHIWFFWLSSQENHFCFPVDNLIKIPTRTSRCKVLYLQLSANPPILLDEAVFIQTSPLMFQCPLVPFWAVNIKIQKIHQANQLTETHHHLQNCRPNGFIPTPPWSFEY